MARLQPLTVVFFALILVSFWAGAAFALKCEVRDLNHDVIEETPFIFEGKLERRRDLTEAERASAKDVVQDREPAASQDDQAGERGLKIYEYSVIHNWKGLKKGERVAVLFDAEWGDTLNFGESALIFGEKKVGEMIWVPLCGLSTSVTNAENRGMIETLRESIGIGYDVKVPGADRVCHTADDCTTVSTHCGGCDCGVPINTASVKKHQQKLAKTCAPDSVNGESCDNLECQPYQPACIEGQCR